MNNIFEKLVELFMDLIGIITVAILAAIMVWIIKLTIEAALL